MASPLEVATGEAQKALKKQKTCEDAVDRSLTDMIEMVTQVRASLGQSSEQPEVVLQQLRSKLEGPGMLGAAVSQTKDLHSAVGKLGKVCRLKVQSVMPEVHATRKPGGQTWRKACHTSSHTAQPKASLWSHTLRCWYTWLHVQGPAHDALESPAPPCIHAFYARLRHTSKPSPVFFTLLVLFVAAAWLCRTECMHLPGGPCI